MLVLSSCKLRTLQQLQHCKPPSSNYCISSVMRLNSLYDLCRKLLFLSLPCRSALAHTQNEAADKLNTLLRRDDCQTNPDWHATQAAWIADDTDKNLATWWQNVSANPHKSFANELGAGFGAHLNGFECGIGAYSTCIAPSCGGMLLYDGMRFSRCR
jgi:hypothetical protein